LVQTHLGDGTTAFFAVTSSGLPVGGISLSFVEKPSDGILVIVMLLALNYDLLATINELITALHREILLSQELASSLDVFRGSVSMLLGDSFGHTTL
jgi:hypothetical protein